MTLDQLFAKVAFARGKKLSGGITCNGLRIQQSHQAGKMPELLITGDVTITLKVFELTSTGAPRLNSLMQYTQHNIANKLKGETKNYGLYLANYNPRLNKFDSNTQAIYDVRYRVNYIVKLEKINRLSQLSGNDFVLGVVDQIRFKTDKYRSGGLTNGKEGPATVAYNDWVGHPNIGTHEFFHTLGLPDLYGQANYNKLMFHLDNQKNNSISTQELSDMNNFLMVELVRMTNNNYANSSFNTVNKLQTFLNNPTYGFKYNKTKFR